MPESSDYSDVGSGGPGMWDPMPLTPPTQPPSAPQASEFLWSRPDALAPPRTTGKRKSAAPKKPAKKQPTKIRRPAKKHAKKAPRKRAVQARKKTTKSAKTKTTGR